MVEGVALEMLCRLLSTEGSNPSLSEFKSKKQIKVLFFFRTKLDENSTLQQEVHLL